MKLAVFDGDETLGFSGATPGIREAGQALDVNGTSEISLVWLDRCLASSEYNARATLSRTGG